MGRPSQLQASRGLLEDAPADFTSLDAAKALYGAVMKSPYGKTIEEAHLPGLLDVDFEC